MLKNRITDALNMVDTGVFKQTPHHIHCNVYGTYYIFSGVEWVAFVMEAGLDYFDLNAKGISLAPDDDGATPVNAGDITLVYL